MKQRTFRGDHIGKIQADRMGKYNDGKERWYVGTDQKGVQIPADW